MSRNRGLFLLRIEQNVNQFIESRVSLSLDLFRFHGPDRMLNHQHRMIRRAKGLALGFRKRIECVGNDGDRKPPPLLQLD